MTKLRNLAIGLLFVITPLFGKCLAQQLIQNERFTYAPLFDNQVVLLKEISLNGKLPNQAYENLKDWNKEFYAKSPLVSSIGYDQPRREVLVKSKIELLLPENSRKVREKVTMSYRLNTLIINGVCVFEVKNITYKLPKQKATLRAEDTISPKALAIVGPQQELWQNIQKGTLFYFNELSDNLTLYFKTSK